MTASKLEESIRKVVDYLYPAIGNAQSAIIRAGLSEALTAFAEAVAAKATEVREKCEIDHKHDHCEEHNQCLFTCWKDVRYHLGPEPKECVETHRVKLEFDLTNGVLENVKTAKADVIRRFYPPHIDTPKECPHKAFMLKSGGRRFCFSCGEFLGVVQDVKEPPADLPDEVKEKILALCGEIHHPTCADSLYSHCDYYEPLASLARLCLSLRKP